MVLVVVLVVVPWMAAAVVLCVESELDKVFMEEVGESSRCIPVLNRDFEWIGLSNGMGWWFSRR